MKKLPLKGKRSFGWRLALGLFIGVMPLLKSNPAAGAETLTLSYGVLQQSISLNELETFANTGSVDPDLAAYVHYATPEQLAQLQQILLMRFPVEVRQVSQFLQTSMGEQILHRLADLIQSDASQPSTYAIEAAFIRAASDPEGLSLLNVLHQFPGEQIKVDVARSLELINALNALVHQTDQLVAQIDQQTNLEASDPNLSNPDLSDLDLSDPDLSDPNLPGSAQSFATLPDPEQLGSFTWMRHTIELHDQTRDRTFPVDIYLPLVQTPRPLIVISHGLSAERDNFTYLAQHLASHGFAVAVPEHVGSNWQYLEELFAGKTDRVIQPQEFIDRPLDITYLLDELSELAQSDSIFKGRLDLQQVGVIGQSLGGYTALALAGAPLNFEHLETDCQDWQNSLNISLLLQCRASDLPRRDYDLADSRVKAVVAISPIGSSIFGQASLSQVNIPVLMMSSTADMMAPALLEQMQPFTWLGTSDKYLALIKGGTHFSSLAPREGEVFTLHQGTTPEASIVHRYVMALSNSFLQTYIADQDGYQSYLSTAYVNQINQHNLPLNLARALTIHQPKQASSGFSWNNPLLFIGLTVQVTGILYFVAIRKRLRSMT